MNISISRLITAAERRARNSVSYLFRKYRWLAYNFGDKERPILKRAVNTYYWRSSNSDNVGDLLSDVIVKQVLSYYGIDASVQLRRTKRLFAIGSIIDATLCPITIWGSGLHDEAARVPKVKLDVRAVRGPRTRSVLQSAGVHCPEIFGDPALLLPLFYKPQVGKEYPYTIIPHFSKQDYYFEKYGDCVITTLTSDWQGFIKRILASELVISGSLHGIIIAEAYGVPAVLLGDIDKDLFKYEDYYFSTGRTSFNVADCVEDALKLAADIPPDFTEIQNALLNSFPQDLWVE